MKSAVYTTGQIAIATLLLAGIAYGSWRISRWFNWEFSYGARVEQQLVELEARVSALEE